MNILLQAKIVKLSKMSVIKSLYIEFIELYVDANYIMNLFYICDIATISRITMHQDKSAYKRAYVEIYEWHDSEVAYNFIKRLKIRFENNYIDADCSVNVYLQQSKSSSILQELNKIEGIEIRKTKN